MGLEIENNQMENDSNNIELKKRFKSSRLFSSQEFNEMNVSNQYEHFINDKNNYPFNMNPSTPYMVFPNVVISPLNVIVLPNNPQVPYYNQQNHYQHIPPQQNYISPNQLNYYQPIPPNYYPSIPPNYYPPQ